MAEKRDPSRRASDSRSAADRKATVRRNETESQASHCRIDVIRCENCGEDYSVTYKRCPFCDERPGRSGIGGRRVAGDYRGAVHPVQVIGLVISLILIIAALFIVFKYVGPLIFGDKSGGGSSSPGTSQSQPGSGSVSQPGSASGGAGSDSSQPDAPAVVVTSLQLSKTDITLSADEEYQLVATVTPADAEITWTSGDPGVLTVDEYGNVKNVNSTSSLVKTTLTASAGDKRAECIVYCKPSRSASGGGSGETPGSGTGTGTGTPSGSVAPNTPGTIINAGSGLNIRSGPGSSYEVVASAPNGAKITVLEDSGTGWYKIDYGAGKTGYVSSSYVSIGS